MQQIISNFLYMVQAVLAILNKDKAAWENEPLIVSEIEATDTRYNSVMNTINSVSGLNQKGHTIAKNNTFDTIMELTLKLSKKLSVFARKTSDSSLLLLTNHSLNSLSTGMEKDAMSRCVAIINKAESLLPQLEVFKITAADLASIRNLIDEYNGHINERSNSKTDKYTLTQDISEQISSLRAHLDVLDDLVEGFIDDREVINRYKASRSINNYGKSKTGRNKPENPQA